MSIQALSGYEGVEESHRTTTSRLVRAMRIGDGQVVFLKALLSERTELQTRQRLRHEYRILRDIDGRGVPHTFGLRTTELGLMLELAFVRGEPLRAPACEIPIGEGLEIALKIARILVHVHSRGVTHRDLCPENILYDRDSGDLHLIHFDAATRLSHDADELGLRAARRDHLGYISPEQTGRMNRPVDWRTDFYSLGVVLYELFSGQTPFGGEDPLEIIHATVARVPPRLDERRRDIPQTLARVIAKLLSKMAEDRYQSAIGLAEDLEACLTQWQKSSKIDDFQVGRTDRFSGTLPWIHPAAL